MMPNERNDRFLQPDNMVYETYEGYQNLAYQQERTGEQAAR
uniref:Uncharacterized protein n=1 Tax=Thermosporothrix sp. COM3 TaxID=2490863 RepID=A0A455SK53_9CHLR|nr:hypothetical protein KTC_27510 [Thermosporothrix sp. COM3]